MNYNYIPTLIISYVSPNTNAKLYISQAPGTNGHGKPRQPQLDNDLAVIHQLRITQLIDVLPKYQYPLDLLARDQINVTYYPLSNSTMPDLNTTHQLIDQIIYYLRAGENVLIHCHEGVSRSAAMAALVLLHMGYTPDWAINYIQRIRAGSFTLQMWHAYVNMYYQTYFGQSSNIQTNTSSNCLMM